MSQQDQIIELLERVQRIETTIALDRFKAEQEKTHRQHQKDQVAADRLTVKVKRENGDVVLAEYIKDPIKFKTLVGKNIIEKVRGTWVVHPGIAERHGHLVMEV